MELLKENKDPAQWCRDMADKAKDGDEAYNYHQLAEMYENKSKG